MGHRDLPDSFQLFEMEQHQFRNYATTEQSYNFLGRSLYPENGSLAQTRGNLLRSEVHFRYHANPGSRLNPVSSFSSEMHCHRPASSGPSYGYHPYSSVAGNSNYRSSDARPPFAGYSDRGINGVMDTATATGRVPFKRKSPDASIAFDTGSSNWASFEGSSSRSGYLEKPFDDNQNISRYPVGFQQYSGSNHSTASNDSARNVRSRSGLNLAPTAITNHLNFDRHTTNVPTNHSVAAHYPHSNADASAPWNFNFTSPHGPGRIPASEINGVSGVENQFLAERRTVEVDQYSHDATASRNFVPPSQYLHVPPSNHRAERYGSHSISIMPSYREQTHHVGYGCEATSSNYRLRFPTEGYFSRYSRSSSTGTWHGSYQSDRGRRTTEGFPSLATTMDRSDRLENQHHVMSDYTISSSPRVTDTYDQYEDMRLDIDNMSYEELLALEERIGNVKTGLSEIMMSNCLVEFMYCAPKQKQEEKTCSICLEEFSNMEKAGRLMNCEHEYHVTCIAEWLTMKNICPICKRTVASSS